MKSKPSILLYQWKTFDYVQSGSRCYLLYDHGLGPPTCPLPVNPYLVNIRWQFNQKQAIRFVLHGKNRVWSCVGCAAVCFTRTTWYCRFSSLRVYSNGDRSTYPRGTYIAASIFASWIIKEGKADPMKRIWCKRKLTLNGHTESCRSHSKCPHWPVHAGTPKVSRVLSNDHRFRDGIWHPKYPGVCRVRGV